MPILLYLSDLDLLHTMTSGARGKGEGESYLMGGREGGSVPLKICVTNESVVADCKWDSSSDRALEAIKTRKNDEDEAILRETISKVTDINAWHTYKNVSVVNHRTFLPVFVCVPLLPVDLVPLPQAEFNLLFHAVIEDNRSGFDILLEAGADPAMKNHSGNSAMNLVLIKRKLVDWAAAAVEAVRKVHGDEGARKFVDRIKTSSGAKQAVWQGRP